MIDFDYIYCSLLTLKVVEVIFVVQWSIMTPAGREVQVELTAFLRIDLTYKQIVA
jgi:hypothetical protein